MIKNIVKRALLGFPLGVFVGYTVTVFLSLFFNPGAYLSAEPGLIAILGGEVPAVVAQYFLSGLLGAGFAAGTLIWEMETWSITRRTAAHLLLTSVLMFPIAYLTYWMPHTLLGILQYILIWLVLYALIWVWQYLAWMRKVQAINRKLRNP